MAVRDIAARAAGAPEAARTADLEPVGGAVAGSGEALRIDKSLGQKDVVAVPGEPVAGQAAQAQAEHARSEVRGARGVRQQEETRVVDDQEQAQAAPAELAEAEVVVLAQQRVEARHLVGPHGAHAHLAQRNRFVGHFPSYATNGSLLFIPFCDREIALGYTSEH